MSAIYADVIVDINSAALDRVFTYDAAGGYELGMRVEVPFGGRRIEGYIIGFRQETELDPARVRSITRPLESYPALTGEQIELARYMQGHCKCTLSAALRLMIPAQMRGERVRARTERRARLLATGPELDAAIESLARAPRRRELLETLRDLGGEAAVSQLPKGSSDALRKLAGAGVIELSEGEKRRAPAVYSSGLSGARPTLTPAQARALEELRAGLDAGERFLLHGVTGSGKTEVYMRLIEEVLSRGRTAILLVPEISLTAQTVGRFRSRFGDDVAILHSRLSAGERFDQWDMVRLGSAHVVVGARSALFAPLRDVGLIIIDEEHEWTYKQESAPRYHAREVAARMAAERGCALVLGSATPSLEALERCREGTWGGVSWTRVSMPERPGAARLPTVRVVDMTEQFSGGNRSIFSAPLAEALQDVAAKRQKAVLMLNRRGFANFLMCRECGCVPECPHCSTALTYHERTHALVCHTCGRSWPVRAYPDPSTRCPNCGSRYLGAYGVGTQRVEDELAMLLPEGVEVIRMDADTTRAKGAHQRLLERFDAAESAVLVGTQMIAKGLDFPEVTLVGVINADTMLKLPDFRAAERTYDLLEQVAGRAGRGGRPGEVIVQTYWATHPAMQAVLSHRRDVFLAPELAERKEASYPPFSRLANILVWGKNARAVEDASAKVAAALREKVSGLSGWEVLGPADCVKARVKDRSRRHVMVKAPLDADLGGVVSECAAGIGRGMGINMALDIDAYDLM